jgi:RNA polymerase sigma-70 factor (ECF subfamily)
MTLQSFRPHAAGSADLVERMARGEKEALGELYDQTCRVMYAVALRIVSSPADAEEVIHDAYTRAFRHVAAYRPDRGSVHAWLVLITRSVAIDRLRAIGRKAAQALDAIPEPASKDESPEERSLARQLSGRLQSALQALDPDQRRLIELAFFEGLSHTDLADRTKLPLGTVKTKIRGGLLKLRAYLGDWA